MRFKVGQLVKYGRFDGEVLSVDLRFPIVYEIKLYLGDREMILHNISGRNLR